MPSIHFWKSRDVARSKGAWLGALTTEQADSLGRMSKRELIEVALHLASLSADEQDSPASAYSRVVHERDTLTANGLL